MSTEGSLNDVNEEESTQASPPACPHLGLDGDPSTHSAGSTPGHRCYAGSLPVEVDEERQSYYCLSNMFDLCPRRVLGVPAEIPDAPAAEATPVSDPLPPVPPKPAGLRIPALATLAVLAAGAVLGVMFVLNSGVVSDRASAPASSAASPDAHATNPATASQGTPGAITLPAGPTNSAAPPTPGPSPVAGLTLAGGSLSGATPTVVPPTRSPTTQPQSTTYVVPYGDTLTKISQRFGVPIEDIMSANNIVDRNLILTGRTLIIPNPR